MKFKFKHIVYINIAYVIFFEEILDSYKGRLPRILKAWPRKHRLEWTI